MSVFSWLSSASRLASAGMRAKSGYSSGAPATCLHSKVFRALSREPYSRHLSECLHNYGNIFAMLLQPMTMSCNELEEGTLALLPPESLGESSGTDYV